jgi:hypothetical protein
VVTGAETIGCSPTIVWGLLIVPKTHNAVPRVLLRFMHVRSMQSLRILMRFSLSGWSGVGFDRRMFEPDLIVLVVHQMEAFFTMSLIDQTVLLRICVSPFVATDEEVEELRVRCLVGPSEAVS